MQADLFLQSAPGLLRTADVSACGDYRWSLGRRWAEGPCLAWLMLNPSRADAEGDDPTLMRVTAFSRRWGYGSLRVVNLYPFRSPHPAALASWLAAGLGVRGAMARNAEAVAEALDGCAGVVAAWGAKGDTALAAQALAGRRTLCLGTTLSGAPLHPLARGRMRVPDDSVPRHYRLAA